MKRQLTSALLASAILLSGCQSVAPVQAGFMDSYDNFRQHPYVDDAQLWIKPGVSRADIAGYQQFVILPIEVWPDSNGYQGVTPAELSAITGSFRKALIDTLAPEYLVVDQSGEKTALIRIAITDLTRSVPEKGVLDYIPVRLVISAGKDAALALAGKEYSAVKASLELEFYDSLTGKRLAAVIDRKNGDSFIQEKNENDMVHMQKLFELWIKRFKKSLDDIKA